MPGLSQYAPRPQNIDEALQRVDAGAPTGTLPEARQAMPQPQAQGSNPWLQWLMQYMQTKQGQQPQGQPR
jgi:hypothetical protein